MSLLSLRIFKIVSVLLNPVYREIFIKYRVIPSLEHSSVLASIPQPDIVIDAGANNGQFALICRNFFPQVLCYSFEPLDDACYIYNKVFQSSNNFYLFQFALGAKEQSLCINISARSDSSSLLPISKLQNLIFPGTHSVDTQTVSVRRLDSFFDPKSFVDKISFLKVDVQGFELEVLSGAFNILSSFDFIYCECSFVQLYKGQSSADEVIKFLLSSGFELQGIYNNSYDSNGVSIQADFLFRNSQS